MPEKEILKVGIDLLSIKPKKSGGVESFIKNLLKGFAEISTSKMHFYLITSTNNQDLFTNFERNYKIFTCVPTKVNSEHVVYRILWENFFLNRVARSLNLDMMYVPTYSKPLWNFSDIPYIITIHDLQALHYPEYFSKVKNIWLRFAWKRCAKTSTKIVAISNFVKDDIVEKLKIPPSKIKVIYNPIILSKRIADFSRIAERYNIMSKKYFYTVSSMLPHKNLEVLLKLISKLKNDLNNKIPNKLVISGVGGTQKRPLTNLINTLQIKENVIITGFISDEERDALYANAYAFLFPSLFEGFGMPPIEAMVLGTPVITTKCASIPEVTKGLCFYVDNPTDQKEWLEKIKNIKNADRKPHYFEEYDIINISKKYLSLLLSYKK